MYIKIGEMESQANSIKQNDRFFCSDVRLKGIWEAIANVEKNFDFEDFDIVLKMGESESQQQSGRCWIYSGFNFIKPIFLEKNHIREICFSQEYIAFYDLLEKSNFFLEYIINNVKIEQDNRTFSYKLSHPIQDAGQWSMFCNILKKYGVIPKSDLETNKNSENTSDMIGFLENVLRTDAYELRNQFKKGISKEGLRVEKKIMLNEIYRYLCVCMGTPPQTLDICLKSCSGKDVKLRNITPKEFYNQYMPKDIIENTVALVSYGSKECVFRIKHLGNVIEGDKVRYLNVQWEEFERLIITQLQDGLPVWFGCDSRHDVNRNKGILSMGNFKYSRLGRNCCDREAKLDYGISQLTHSMVLCGVKMDAYGKPCKWLALNSYGKDAGHNGFVGIEEEWFKMYVFEAVVLEKYLNKRYVKLLNEKAKKLEMWSPLGALAD